MRVLRTFASYWTLHTLVYSTLINIIGCSKCDRVTEAILEYYEASKQANREVQLWNQDQVYVLQMTFMDFDDPQEVRRLACALENVHSVRDLSWLLHIAYQTILPIYQANRQMFTPIYIYLYELDASIRRRVGHFLRRHHVIVSPGYPLSTFMSYTDLRQFLHELQEEFGPSWTSAFTVQPSEVLNVDTLVWPLYESKSVDEFMQTSRYPYTVSRDLFTGFRQTGARTLAEIRKDSAYINLLKALRDIGFFDLKP